MIKVIKAEDKLSYGEIEKMINSSEEFDTIAFEGVFRFQECNKRFFMLGKEAVQSFIMVTRSNVRLDFSNAKIFYELNALTCKLAFFYLFQTARDVRITGLDLHIHYTGDKSKQTVYGLYNCGHSITVSGCKIEIDAEDQINATGIYNHGGLDTHLDTQADNLSIVNSRIKVQIHPREIDLPCEACGVRNYFANSMQISDTYIEIRNKGNSHEQRAVGIFNNGRFCRFSNDNIKANGSHNKGVALEEAHACGMIDQGMYSLISNCNIVGEWGGSCVGLLLKGEFTKVSGCKILSTHTIKGTTVRLEGRKIILSDNILTSTSRNARIVYALGDVITITGNIMEVLQNPDICITGVGAFIENVQDAIFSNNQLRTLKTCGLFLWNSTITAKDNLFQKEGRPAKFVEIARDSSEFKLLLDENMISSISLTE